LPRHRLGAAPVLCEAAAQRLRQRRDVAKPGVGGRGEPAQPGARIAGAQFGGLCQRRIGAQHHRRGGAGHQPAQGLGLAQMLGQEQPGAHRQCGGRIDRGSHLLQRGPAQHVHREGIGQSIRKIGQRQRHSGLLGGHCAGGVAQHPAGILQRAFEPQQSPPAVAAALPGCDGARRRAQRV